jgi:hypothetical protein
LKQAGIEANKPYLSLYHSGEPDSDVEVCAPFFPNAAGIQGLSDKSCMLVCVTRHPLARVFPGLEAMVKLLPGSMNMYSFFLTPTALTLL